MVMSMMVREVDDVGGMIRVIAMTTIAEDGRGGGGRHRRRRRRRMERQFAGKGIDEREQLLHALDLVCRHREQLVGEGGAEVGAVLRDALHRLRQLDHLLARGEAFRLVFLELSLRELDVFLRRRRRQKQLLLHGRQFLVLELQLRLVMREATLAVLLQRLVRLLQLGEVVLELRLPLHRLRLLVLQLEQLALGARLVLRKAALLGLQVVDEDLQLLLAFLRKEKRKKAMKRKERHRKKKIINIYV